MNAEPTTRNTAQREGLAAALDRVGRKLDLRAAELAGEPAPTSPDGFCEHEEISPLRTLVEIFGLSPFERDLLLLCAGVELDGSFPARCAAAAGEPRRAYPTFSLALSALSDTHWSALSPAAPLRYWRLIELSDHSTDAPLTTRPLRIDERILHFLVGVTYLDERLRGVLRRVPEVEVSAAHAAVAGRAAAAACAAGRAPPALQICGEDRSAAYAIAARAAAGAALDLYAIHADDIPTGPDGETCLRLWERDAALSGAALLIDAHRCDNGLPRAAAAFAVAAQGVVFVAAPQAADLAGRASLRFDVPRSTAVQRQALWKQALGPVADAMNGELDAVASHFDLDLAEIRSIGDQVRRAASLDAHVPGQTAGRLLWDACRAGAAPRLAALADLASRIEPAAGWDDLVLPAAQKSVLREITFHVRHRFTVYGKWGFASKGSRGQGASVLFAGASGTGKTMAAEVLAAELGLDLFRVDLSACVSKYIGETEKNLRRIFDAAECGGAVLLFDEADALFGKRSEVKDSHDRYANVEVSYLLQRMESYRGLAILTTNQKSALDTAFLRRLRFIVQFPFPDASQRAEIWRRVFPEQTPTEDLDEFKLARLNMAGGNIRNVALAAAFLAAESGTGVRMSHILAAARSECAKLEKPLTDAEIGGWA